MKMIINKNLIDYILNQNASINDALTKINRNKRRLAYVVNDENNLVGSISDGDIRRWLINEKNPDFNKKIKSIMNSQCFKLFIHSQRSEIRKNLNHHYLSIPLIDDLGHVVAIAENEGFYFEIESRRISNTDPSFIIAEVGNNHQGDIELAKDLIDAAITCGVDCVKFQMRNISKLYRNFGNSSDTTADLGTQYTLDLLAKYQLTDKELFEIFDYCKSKGSIPLCTPWDLDSFYKLEDYGMSAYKIASADFTNFELLEEISKTGKLMICSTGMSNESEIQSSIEFLKQKMANFILLHSNSTYPTPFKDINLNYIKRLSQSEEYLVGYSGHERGWAIPVASIALGAKVIEKHITLDKSLEGNDHKVSLLPSEFKEMVQQIRDVEKSMGFDGPREISQGEKINREVLAKSLIINRDLEIGEIVTKEMIDVKSPGQGLQPNRIHELIGKKVERKFKSGDFFYESDVNGLSYKKSAYNFKRPYGIPVRYHDYTKLISGINIDFVEFHLSYKDLELDIDKYLTKNQKINFAVHAPELFLNDHLLDLCSLNEEYRRRSIHELRNVIKHTEKLNQFFPKTVKPIVVVNVGGWDTQHFLNKDKKKLKYELTKQAFLELNTRNVEIAIQTMPPFPWHFGGQSYHNLFVDPSEIKEFCKQTDLKLCLDISHAMMSCNYYGWSLTEYIKEISPYVVHIHIADAKGTDGEGFQIGEGDVNFDELATNLNENLRNIQFIPEIWQGHKDQGNGFWFALSYLENHGF